MTRKRHRGTKTIAGAFSTVCILLVALAVAYFFPQEDGLPTSQGQPSALQGQLLVSFLDVGQGDCTLIQAGDQTVLIDAGDLGDGDRLVQRLQAEGVDRIDLLLATHPHADHIGGMPEVVEAFEVGRVLFGEVPDSILPTSKVYERLLDRIDEADIPVEVVEPEQTFQLDNGASLRILGPLKGYNDLNNTSIICRLDFGETGFLFTGDAEAQSETDLLAAYPASAFGADVLKLGHHGSSTSSTEAFLKSVQPEYAIASCGLENSYGHPHREILQRTKELGITLLRTDLDGDVRFASDGQTLVYQAA